MQIYAVFLLTLIYSAYGANFEHNHRPVMMSSGSAYSDSSEEIQSSRTAQAELLNELQDALRDTLPAGSNQFQSSASQLPQAASFKTKVMNRLQHSESTPELKRKLIKVADQKLENCKTLSGNELDRGCVGRLTGQIMQLINAMENMNRPIAASEGQRRQFHY